jgi:dienelactone hydrolase
MAAHGRSVHRPIAAMVTLVALAVVSCSSGTSPTSSTASTSDHARSLPSSPSTWPRIAETAAPAGFSAPAATWLTITGRDGQTRLAAEFRPRGSSARHPVVVLLHGSSGLARPQLDWAPRLADAGFVVVVGCYLDAFAPAVQANPDLFLACPSLPDFQHAAPETVRKSYRVLLDAAARRPGVKRGAIGVLGVSAGANVALSYDDARVHAIVADSGYRTTPGSPTAPVLLLGMMVDPNVDHALLVRFEQAMQAAGSPVDAHYYPGIGHVVILGRAPAADDATSRITTFLHRYLR